MTTPSDKPKRKAGRPRSAARVGSSAGADGAGGKTPVPSPTLPPPIIQDTAKSNTTPQPSPSLASLTPSDITLMVRSNPAFWFEVFGKILDKSGQIVAPRANEYQRKIVMAYLHARKTGVPCRLICLKPRQKGSSTISTALSYTHLRNFRAAACFVGNKDKTTQNLLSMVRRYNDSDRFPWGNNGKVLAEGGNWSHGSRIVSETAGASDPGRSGTFQVMVLSEVAHWQNDGARSADVILNGLLNCVPWLADTLVLMESTPNGAAGAFYERYAQAISLDDFMAGKPSNGYVRIFSPWYEFADSEDKLDPPAASNLEESLTLEEKEIMARYSLRLGHIAYRRRTIATECQGEARLFDQEYPSNEEDCWLSSGRLRFDGQGMANIGKQVKAASPAFGILDVQNGGEVVWRNADKNESVFTIWEQPKVGCSYIMPVDVMTGSQASGKDPDCHSAMILRAPYVSGGVERKAAVVARISSPARFDLDVLADFVVRLSSHYGNCLVVPEVNGPGLALIELLRQYPAVSIYKRQAFDQLSNRTTEKLGWQTSDGAGRTGNRSMLIERLAASIREGELDIYCPSILAQMRAFIVNDRGKAEALPGKHDDDVMSLAIGLFCMSGATTLREKQVVRSVPRDLMEAMRAPVGVPSRVRQYT